MFLAERVESLCVVPCKCVEDGIFRRLRLCRGVLFPRVVNQRLERNTVPGCPPWWDVWPEGARTGRCAPKPTKKSHEVIAIIVPSRAARRGLTNRLEFQVPTTDTGTVPRWALPFYTVRHSS